jgi:CheY-like chemotaxis protein
VSKLTCIQTLQPAFGIGPTAVAAPTGTAALTSDGLTLGAHASLGLLAAKASQRPGTKAAGRLVDGRRPERVLVVEDCIDAADSLTLLLQTIGYQAHAAYSSSQAIELAREIVPDLVVLDLALPGLEGFALARTLRAQPPLRPLRIVALTAYHESEYRQLARDAGLDAYLVKPLDLAALLHAAERAPV